MTRGQDGSLLLSYGGSFIPYFLPVYPGAFALALKGSQGPKSVFVVNIQLLIPVVLKARKPPVLHFDCRRFGLECRSPVI